MGVAPPCPSVYAGVAQLVEHRICNAGVAGSTPVTSFLAPSSNGRTPDFDSGNRGSNPRGAYLQGVR